jgi:multisubunit Na+/H+ antiporter MnhB subunit
VNSLIFRQVTRAVFPASLVFAVHLLLRGHDQPGGGFIAGLVITMTVVLEALAFGADAARRRYRLVLRPALWVGLGVAIGSGLVPMLWGFPPFGFPHGYVTLPGGRSVHLSATLAFDLGVVLVIIGAMGTALVVMIGLKRKRVVQ